MFTIEKKHTHCRSRLVRSVRVPVPVHLLFEKKYASEIPRFLLHLLLENYGPQMSWLSVDFLLEKRVLVFSSVCWVRSLDCECACYCKSAYQRCRDCLSIRLLLRASYVVIISRSSIEEACTRGLVRLLFEKLRTKDPLINK